MILDLLIMVKIYKYFMEEINASERRKWSRVAEIIEEVKK